MGIKKKWVSWEEFEAVMGGNWTPSPHTHDRSDITDFFNSPFWENIPDKPSTFPPSSHQHTRSQITDFWDSPFWASIPDKPSTYAPSAHASSHEAGGSDKINMADLDDFGVYIDQILLKTANVQFGSVQLGSYKLTAAGLVADDKVKNSDKLDGYHASAFASAGHSHDLIDLSDVQCGTLNDGDILVWNQSLGKWVDQQPAGVGPHSDTHEDGGSDEVSHDLLWDFVANEHINHADVSINTGNGLQGGGNITASRNLSLGVLTANHDFGDFYIRALRFISDVATGTKPLTVTSTTKCTNLNADLWDNKHLPTLESGKFLTNDGSNISWGLPSTGGCDKQVSVKLASNQSIDSSTPTKVNLTSEDYDPDGKWDTANKRYQPGVAGYYAIKVNIHWSQQANYNFKVAIYKNGSADTFQRRMKASQSTYYHQELNTDMYLGASDYIEVWVWHDYTAVKNIYQPNTRFCAFRFA